ncbi:MAG: AraC family transcriptional regulator [Pseudomonadota bacterium]|nr:AraC family transcriptional regulator [Pseudomonadota bacterium]
MNADSLPHPSPQGMTIYHWRHGLLLLAPTLVLERTTTPLCATLRLACNKPYTINVAGEEIETWASLVAPRVERRKVIAIDSHVALFYFPIEWPEYRDLQARISGRDWLNFEADQFTEVIDVLRPAFSQQLEPDTVIRVARQAVEAMTGARIPAPQPVDARIDTLRRRLDETPLNEVNVEQLARDVGLSAARTRTLFKQQIGTTIQHYARWAAIWKAIKGWSTDRTLTEVAIDAGFYDLAHADHTFIEMFGIAPSLVVDQRFVTIVPCQTRPDTDPGLSS